MAKYVRSEKGATVTIFAPYDCENKCPFCINKKDYQDNKEFDIEKVKESIKLMDIITPNCDFVITGGEPLANIDAFVDLVELIRELNNYGYRHGTHHDLFINTTLPIKHEDIKKINQYSDVITGFNISRHLVKYVKECPDEWIGELKIPVRINCVLYNTVNIEKANDLIARFNCYPNITGFQFRDNYIGVTHENLFNRETNEILKALINIIKPGDNCTYHRENFRWNVKFGNISFHRTQCYSKIPMGKNLFFIGDVIIDPRGLIKDDWNEHGEPLDIFAYKYAI